MPELGSLKFPMDIVGKSTDEQLAKYTASTVSHLYMKATR